MAPAGRGFVKASYSMYTYLHVGVVIFVLRVSHRETTTQYIYADDKAFLYLCTANIRQRRNDGQDGGKKGREERKGETHSSPKGRHVSFSFVSFLFLFRQGLLRKT